MKKIRVPFLVVAFGLFCFIVSCNTRLKHPVVLAKTYSTPMPPIYFFIDTPKTTKPIVLTDSAKKRLLDKFYQYGQDHYYGPRFDKLEAIIDKQAKSIDYLTTYLQVSRHRSDSIVKERNFYRQISDAKDTAYQNRVIGLQKQLIGQQSLYDKENRKQINFNTTVAVCCLVGVVAIGLFLLALWLRVNALYKNFVKYA